LVKPTCLRR